MNGYMLDKYGRAVSSVEGNILDLNIAAASQGYTFVMGDWSNKFDQGGTRKQLALLTQQDVVMLVSGVLLIAEARIGTLVLVDGERIEVTDNDGLELTFSQPGQYTVELDVVGFHVKEIEVTVDEG